MVTDDPVLGERMLRARRVLNDCETSYELLEAESDETKFRILWVAGMTLARAVGHVLVKVDSSQNERLKQAISTACQSWKRDRDANRIFWDFIEDERNRVLKEYELSFLSGKIPIISSDRTFTLDQNLFCPITDGAFAGEDCRDILKDAIVWWEGQLRAIEGETEE